MASLDKTDLRILKALQEEAKITNQDLALKIHLSPSSCLMRVRKLEQAGILESYHAVINLKKICRMVQCIVTISMKNQSRSELAEFQEYVKSIPEVLECYTVSGAFDFFLKIAAPNMERYNEITDQLLESSGAEFHLSTHVVMEENKVSHAYPLEQLM